MSGARPVAIVTGGARGIGFGISLELARSGYDLAVSGRKNEADVSGQMEELRSLGARAIYVQSDVAEAADRERLIARVREEFGRLDCLVNNAGIAPSVRADILDADEASFDRLIAVNLRGPYFLTQLAARWMAEERRGAIVFITSVSSVVASVNRGDYCLTKAALSMAAKLWAARMAEFGVSAYEVRPGIIETDMTSGVKGKYDRLIEDGLLLERRWGRPEDVGRAVAALARGDIPYATGQVLTLDGGMSLQRL